MAKQKHSKHRFHLTRIGLFATLLIAFFIVRLDAAGSIAPKVSGSVLAYATETSRGGLLAATNAARVANGLSPLTLESRLNSAAQMKAEDMGAKNYWAHVAPDGTQPWYFFSQAGYSYVRAGENLAYGFSSSQTTVDGWMNSPSHRDNILGNYSDVGFGFINIPDYQSNGNQTIVVAHYGTPQVQSAVTTPPPSAPTTPVPSPAASTPSATPSTPAAPEVTKPAESQPTQAQPKNEEPTTTSEAAQQAPVANAQVKTAAPAQISVLSMLKGHNLPLAALVSFVLVTISVVGYALTHRVAFQHALTTGEHYVATHPSFDTAIVAAVATLILLTTYGNVG